MNAGTAGVGGRAAINLTPYQGLKRNLIGCVECAGRRAAINLNPYQGLKPMKEENTN